MSMLTTTVTSKRQVTIPKELDKGFPVTPGLRLTWSVENNALVARRARTVPELAGCLTPSEPFPGVEAEKQVVDEARKTFYSSQYGKA
jgi:bifunctional DNA-binding transcriptional regulator/antitoxin component of YhaV-PrlF toxin-antitoxin module